MLGKLLVVLLLLACVIDSTDAWRRRRRRRRRRSYHHVTHVVHVHHVYHHYHHSGHSSHSHHVIHHSVHHITVHHIVHHRGHVTHHYTHHVIHHGHYRHHITHRHHSRRHSSHSHHSRMHKHHSRMARHHHRRHVHHKRMARHHHRRHKHHKRMAKHHKRRRNHHRRLAKHHKKRAKHHRRKSRHHARMARHHARHGRHHLARHHRRLAHHHGRHARHHHRKANHHRRRARHHHRKMKHHRRRARHHKKRRNHHRRMARHHKKRRNHHRRHARHHRRRLHSILHGRMHKPHRHLGMHCYRQVRALARARTSKQKLRATRRLAHCRHSSKHVGHLKYHYKHHHRNPDAWSPSCHSKRCVCRSSIRHYRRALRHSEHLAQRCGMVDSGCVDKRYRRVAGIRLRIEMLHRKCHKHIRRRPKHLKHHMCGHAARRYLRRQKGRRAAYMARVHKCSDEDAYCVKRLLKKVLVVNRKVHKRSQLCGIRSHFSPHAKVHSSFKCHMKHEFRDGWHNALLCPSKMVHFRRWVKFWNCKRKQVFAESCQCNPLDTSCLRSHFTQIRDIQTRISVGRTLFTEDIRTCDECAPLKLHFMRWVHRQQVRRNRIHDSICRCPARDLDCSRRRVVRIKLVSDQKKCVK